MDGFFTLLNRWANKNREQPQKCDMFPVCADKNIWILAYSKRKKKQLWCQRFVFHENTYGLLQNRKEHMPPQQALQTK